MRKPAKRHKGLTASGLQVAGVVALCVGGFMVGAWLGWLLAGTALVTFGVALERD
jgi:hypothetical protein